MTPRKARSSPRTIANNSKEGTSPSGRGDKDKMFFYESFAEGWDRQMDPDELKKRLRLIFGRLLSEGDVKGRLTLDAGSGTGHFSRALSEWGARLVSIDLGPKLLGEVRKKCRTRPVCGSLLELPFADGTFETVLSTEVIEHTTDPERAVSELVRVLAPGGLLVLTVPNRVWKPAVVAANILGVRPYEGNENWVSYRALRRWLEDAGLSLETQRGFNILPHTVFCRPAFEFLDAISPLHPFMINIAVRGRKR